MGTIYYAINHDRKEVFYLGKAYGADALLRPARNNDFEAFRWEMANIFVALPVMEFNDLVHRLWDFDIQLIDDDGSGEPHEYFCDYWIVDAAYTDPCSWNEVVGELLGEGSDATPERLFGGDPFALDYAERRAQDILRWG